LIARLAIGLLILLVGFRFGLSLTLFFLGFLFAGLFILGILLLVARLFLLGLLLLITGLFILGILLVAGLALGILLAIRALGFLVLLTRRPLGVLLVRFAFRFLVFFP